MCVIFISYVRLLSVAVPESYYMVHRRGHSVSPVFRFYEWMSLWRCLCPTLSRVSLGSRVSKPRGMKNLSFLIDIAQLLSICSTNVNRMPKCQVSPWALEMPQRTRHKLRALGSYMLMAVLTCHPSSGVWECLILTPLPMWWSFKNKPRVT